uniref:Uncharacterized protein n=1 Tax=Anguilla anguilla TaxID=7936 RepID=A0A0E9TWR6_ANGAN
MHFILHTLSETDERQHMACKLAQGWGKESFKYHVPFFFASNNGIPYVGFHLIHRCSIHYSG